MRTWLLLGLLSLLLFSCGGSGQPSYPKRAEQWYQRALASYSQADIEDAATASAKALELTPNRPEARVLAAKVALANLEYEETLKLLTGVPGTEALSLRARALWYSGKINEAADVLDELLQDPSVRDEWAKQVIHLARRGVGRQPFRTVGARLAFVEMPAGVNAMVVPVEVNGEPALGMIATGAPETVIDSGSRGEPSWVSLRFGGRLEVKDVPALSEDLSGLSRMLNAPVKILLGANLLRHLNPTIDLAGGQFVVRSSEPSPPPDATSLRVMYVRGGGMTVRAAVGSALDPSVMAFAVNTMSGPAVSLTDHGWKKAGFKLSGLENVPSQPELKYGLLPIVKMGKYGLSNVAGVYPADVPKDTAVDFSGVIGVGLLGAFRATFYDGGRGLWIEELVPPEDEVAPIGEPSASPTP